MLSYRLLKSDEKRHAVRQGIVCSWSLSQQPCGGKVESLVEGDHYCKEHADVVVLGYSTLQKRTFCRPEVRSEDDQGYSHQHHTGR